MIRNFIVVVTLAVFPAAVMAQAAPLTPADAKAWTAIAAAENARASTPAQLATLLDGARRGSMELRRISIRALGRLQRADLADSIAAYLHDPAPVLRAEAAHAIALAMIADRNPVRMRATVSDALRTEKNASARAALAETYGRLRLPSADSSRAVAGTLASLVSPSNPALTLGAVRGLHFIARQPAAVRPGLDAARAALVMAATMAGTTPDAIHARVLATETLGLAGLGDESVARRLMKDPDAQVRREVMLFAAQAGTRDTAVAHHIIDLGLHDSAWNVRFEALRQFGTRIARAADCGAIAPLTRDASMHVRVAAIDLLGGGCRPDAGTIGLLDSIARTLPKAQQSEWQPAAHALNSLSAREPGRAAAVMTRFTSHPNLFVRTYAANAAATLRDTSTLRALARDAHPNVRTAAVHGLRALMKHAADSIYIAQLANDDSQLLMEAAAALDSTTTPDIAYAILDALDRVTLQKRENSRDGRVALLNTLAPVGAPSFAARLTPYLSDYDPAVAARAAAILKSWTGADQAPAPVLLPAEPMPTFAALQTMQSERLIVEMMDGSTFTVRLFPFEAPTNAARFEQLARTGWFNGLTLHRVEPNFVVQGGSPNANEYTGAPRFSRDEISHRNDRGTIGLSTRGHDTGDAQIFINTIDNTQLDPLYTVFAEVTSGMRAVDRIPEGAAIRRVTIKR